jgi:FtsH-binding integral membrane protein
MTLLIILLLTAAALVGVFLVIRGLRHHKSSLKTGLIHASLAIAGIVLLLSQIVQGPIDKLNNLAALLLVLALIGGGMVFALREKNKPPAMAVVTIHAIMALVGLSVLIVKYVV